MPTKRQELVIGEILANPRISYRQAMIRAGYSENTATAPSKNLLTKNFKDMLSEAGVTDTKLAEVLNDGLGATRDDKPDYTIRHKYLETGLKVKGHGLVEPVPTGSIYNTFIQNNSLDPSTPEARQLAANTLAILMQQTKRDVT